MNPKIMITYLYDPLCGWCYGASPVLTKVLEQPDFNFVLAPTGLFAGEGARPMDVQFADFAWNNDQRISRLTGQTFSEAYRQNVLGNHTRLFDSALPTLALTAVNTTNASREFEFLKAIQAARYVAGRDNTDPAVLSGILSELDLEDARGRFETRDQELISMYRARTYSAQSDMRELGLNGVPVLIVGSGPRRRVVQTNMLFGNPETLLAEIRRVDSPLPST